MTGATTREQQMTAWRRDLHANPEFGFEESRTAAFMPMGFMTLEENVWWQFFAFATFVILMAFYLGVPFCLLLHIRTACPAAAFCPTWIT